MSVPSERENRLLSQAAFVTGLGDWVVMFAVLSLLHKSTGEVAIAALVVPLNDLGIVVGGLTISRCLNFLSLRSFLLATQVAGAIVSLVMYGILSRPQQSQGEILLLSILFILAILKKYFSVAMEAASRSLGSVTVQRGLQAQLTNATSLSQFLGPILGWALLACAEAQDGFVINAISFLGAAVLLVPLKSGMASSAGYATWAPVRYLRESAPLRRIFLIRSVGLWLPISIANFYLFFVVTQGAGQHIESSAVIYSATGLGGVLGTICLIEDHGTASMLSTFKNWVKSFQDWQIAAFSCTAIALTRLVYSACTNLWQAAGVMCVAGFLGGLMVVTTRSIVRANTTAKQYPEVIALEIALGQSFAVGVGFALSYLTRATGLSHHGGLALSAFFYLVVALALTSRHFRRRPKLVDTTSEKAIMVTP